MISTRLMMLIVMLFTVAQVHASEIAHIDAAEQKRLTNLLFWAVQGKGSLEKIKRLMISGADINIQHGDLNTTLYHDAVDHNRDDVIRELFKNGANPNIKNRLGYTPLHDACRDNKLAAVRALLECEVSIQEKDNEGWTPLDIARYWRSQDVIKLLEEHESIPDVKEPEGD